MKQDIPTISYELYQRIMQLNDSSKRTDIGTQPDKLSVFLKQRMHELRSKTPLSSYKNHKATIQNQKFQIFKGKENQWYFHLKLGNGEIICASDGYPTKEMCKKGIAALKSAAPFSHVEELN